MPTVPIIMPQLGESIAEATIINFLKKVGDTVCADEDVIEVETDKATMTVTSPCSGKIQNYLAQVNESYPVGAVLGHLEATQDEVARAGVETQTEIKTRAEIPGADSPQLSGQKKSVEPTVRGLPVPANAAGASYMSPRLKARMNELGLHAA